MKEAAVILVFGLFFLLASGAFAGGDIGPIDPLNGCFERVGYSGDEIASTQADWVTNRNHYRKIIDPERFARSKQCWQWKAYCIKVATSCRKGGVVVYEGFDWYWREK